MNWTLGGGWQLASDHVNDFGCQRRARPRFAMSAWPDRCREATRPPKSWKSLTCPSFQGSYSLGLATADIVRYSLPTEIPTKPGSN